MKAISLWQPWASLLACGAKKYETRSWATKYRGPVAIHAARKAYCLDEIDFGLVRGFKDAVENVLGEISSTSLPRGAIIATAELIQCHEITEERGHIHIYVGGREPPGNTAPDFYHPTEQEVLFGDWAPRRFAWEFANMKLLTEPIPAKGRQGLWNWEGG